MNKLILTALALAPVLSYAQSGNYHLTVILKNAKAPAKAYLVRDYGMNVQRALDSAAIKEGTFQFKGTVDSPVKADLVIDHAGQGLNSLGRTADVRVVYLEKGNILVKGDDAVKQAVITGPAINTEYAKYHAAVLLPAEKVMDNIEAEYNAAADDKKKDPAFMSGLQAKMEKALEGRDSLQYVYIRKNPDSYLSLEALTAVAGDNMDLDKVRPLFKGLSARLRNSKDGKAFAKLMDEVGYTAIGAMAPDFTQLDVNDKPVKLSDFRGKYVLLDFWASWCGPCRAENPNVVKAFNTYKDKNFTVLGVSLDQPGKKDAWLAAIKADGLDWTQVSDLKFWDNSAAKKYRIRAIPQNFLIDPSGKIVGKNLRGEALSQKLEALLVAKGGK